MIDFFSIDHKITRAGDGDQSYQSDQRKYGRIFDISWSDSHRDDKEREFADLSQGYSGEEIVFSGMSEESKHYHRNDRFDQQDKKYKDQKRQQQRDIRRSETHVRSEQDEEDNDKEISQRFDPACYFKSIGWISQGDSCDQCPYFYTESHPMEQCAENETSSYRKQEEIFLGFSDFFGYERDEISADEI